MTTLATIIKKYRYSTSATTLQTSVIDDVSLRPSQPSREVDQALGIGVVQLGQVHDHRGSGAEMLADRACLVVRTRMQGGDPVRGVLDFGVLGSVRLVLGVVLARHEVRTVAAPGVAGIREIGR